VVLSALVRGLSQDLRGDSRQPSGELERAIVVPDAGAWLLWGIDVTELGFAAVPSPTRAEALVGPARVPEALTETIIETWRRMPDGARHVMSLDGPDLEGRPLEELLREADERSDDRGQPEDGHDETEHGHGGAADGGGGAEHDHGSAASAGPPGGELGAPPDVEALVAPARPPAPQEPERRDHDLQRAGDEQQNMMPIEGRPSSDGLVMEPIEVQLGPLGAILPGGLVARFTLDGDVVGDCSLEATLSAHWSGAEREDALWDPLSAVAWRLAASGAREGRAPAASPWAAIVALELERALSHVAWLRSLGSLLGWAELAELAHAAVRPLLAERRAWPVQAVPQGPRRLSANARPPAALIEAKARVERLRTLLEDSRRLAARTRGRGRLSREEVEQNGATGPIARSAGVERDERQADPRYTELGFNVVTRHDGDALARTLLRISEAGEALRLAEDALRRAREDAAAPPLDAEGAASGATVEGSRGPVQATVVGRSTRLQLEAPGRAAALALAARAAVEEEWSAALVALTSFDLSPWKVAG
jgi:hypothetical protein